MTQKSPYILIVVPRFRIRQIRLGIVFMSRKFSLFRTCSKCLANSLRPEWVVIDHLVCKPILITDHVGTSKMISVDVARGGSSRGRAASGLVGDLKNRIACCSRVVCSSDLKSRDACAVPRCNIRRIMTFSKPKLRVACFAYPPQACCVEGD